MARFTVAEGCTVQAFDFTLDLTAEHLALVNRQFGGRRYAYSWTVRTLKADINAFHQTGAETEKPTLYGLRKRWNQDKDTECVDTETGEVSAGGVEGGICRRHPGSG